MRVHDVRWTCTFHVKWRFECHFQISLITIIKMEKCVISQAKQRKGNKKIWKYHFKRCRKKSATHRNVKSVARDKIRFNCFRVEWFYYSHSFSIRFHFFLVNHLKFHIRRWHRHSTGRERKMEKFWKKFIQESIAWNWMKFAISPEEKLCFQSKPCAVFMWHLFAIWFEIFKIDPIGGWTKVTFSFKVTLSVRCKREDFFSFHQSVS